MEIPSIHQVTPTHGNDIDTNCWGVIATFTEEMRPRERTGVSGTIARTVGEDLRQQAGGHAADKTAPGNLPARLDRVSNSGAKLGASHIQKGDHGGGQSESSGEETDCIGVVASRDPHRSCCVSEPQTS